MIDTMDLTEYLRDKGLQVFKAAGQEVTVHCLFCPDGDPRGKGKLYLNTETWLWECKRCCERGNRKTLLRHFGDEDGAEFAPGEDPSVRREILERATSVAAEMLANNDAQLSYLLRRGLSGETIVARRYGYVPRNWSLSQSLDKDFSIADLQKAGLLHNGREFYAGRILIPYLTHGSVVQLRAKDPEGKYFTAPGDSVRLYNADSIRDAEDVIVTEGEFDCAILEQTLSASADPRARKIAVVGLAGANALPPNFETYFAQAKRVYLGLDPDDTGKRAAVALKEQIGTKARIIELPDDLPKCDWSEYINGRSHGARDVLELMSNASGKRIWSVSDAAVRWRKLAVATPGIKTGFSTFDSIIKPGMTPGQVCIPLAKTGCIQGDAVIAVNRGGKGFTIKLKDLVDRWEGVRYAWDHTIDTYVQREVDGQVRLGRLVNAWHSGVKATFTVTTDTGRTIRATDEHPFLTERGWLRLDELVVGDQVHVRGQRGGNGRREKPVYAKRTVPLHPYAGRRNVRNGGHSVPLHRLVAEAGLNGLDLATFLDRCRTDVTGLRFLDPTAWAVHHVDHDPSNNDPSNLKVVTHPEHAAIHAAEGMTRNVQINIATERVVSVEPYGEEETYDLEVADDPHNFLANGFVVHNTGKTVFLNNLVWNMRDRRVLNITLEQTAAENYDVLRRIVRFHDPLADDEAITRHLPYLRIVDENKLSSEDFSLLVQEYTDDVGERPEVVFVDYLGYYARGIPGDGRYDKTSNAVMQLKAEAKKHEVVVISPHQVNRGAEDGKPLDADDARDSGVVEETADYLLSLYRPEDAVAPGMINGAFNLGILKSRRGGRGKVVPLRFSGASLVIVDLADRKAVSRIDIENARLNRGDTYQEILQDSITEAAGRQQMMLPQDVQTALLHA